MSGHLINGFTVLIDGNLVAVVEDTFENATLAAAEHIATASPTAKIKICSASSQIVGVGVSPQREWNYDRSLKQWVEFLR